MARRRAEPPLDPFERAARRVDPEYARLVEAAEPPRSLRAPRLLALFAVLVVGVTIARTTGSGGGKGPALERRCDRSAFVTGSTALDRGETLKWAATGPAADDVVLAVDSPRTPAKATVTEPRHLTDCLTRSSFQVQVPPGKHTLTAYLVAPDKTTTPIATKPLTVR
jgi:hypothetical protein